MTDKIHWLGHSAICIEAEKKTIYFDPYQLKEGLPQADIIFISHGHFDHCSKADVEKIYCAKTVIIGPHSIESKLSYPIKAVAPQDKISLGEIIVEAVPAYNIGKIFHPKTEGWLGFIVNVGETRFYHAGDTDNIPEMRAIKADIAFLPIGGTYTMNPEEAACAANIINPGLAIPMHWGDSVGSYQDALGFQKLCHVPVKILDKE